MAPRGPAIDRVAAVAVDLGDLATRVVFIGGAIAPLLQTDPSFPRARVTSDVDGVVASSTYAESERLHRELALRGFRQAIGDTRHVHRWTGPSEIPFDLVPAGEHLGGSGNPWDVIAIETAAEATIGRSITIRHVTAPAFLAQKWAAHHDRGLANPCSRAVRAEWCDLQSDRQFDAVSLSSGWSLMLWMWSTSIAGAEQPGAQHRGNERKNLARNSNHARS